MRVPRKSGSWQHSLARVSAVLRWENLVRRWKLDPNDLPGDILNERIARYSCRVENVVKASKLRCRMDDGRNVGKRKKEGEL